MKYLKSFLENSTTNLESDLLDIFLELKDSGFYTKIDAKPSGYKNLNTTSDSQSENLITIDVYKSKTSDLLRYLFTWDDVEDCFERALEYLSSYGISTYKITIYCYQKVDDEVDDERQYEFDSAYFFKTVEEFKKFMTEKFLSENKFGQITFSLSKN